MTEIFDYLSLVEIEKKEEAKVGNAKDGLTVECRPELNDPEIVQRQSRVMCLIKPYPACYSCQHSSFTILFKTDKEERYEQVSCPRWSNAAGRVKGESPDGYVSVEAATCSEMPFEFCPSCPSRKNVATTGADKSVPGWYGRWNRISKQEREGDDE